VGTEVTWLSVRRIVQADSVSDSDSESRNKNEEIIPVNRLTQTVCTDPPAPANSIRTRTVKQRTFFASTGTDCRNRSRNLNLPALPTGADSRNRSRNLNLPALPTGADSRNRSRNLNLPALNAYPYTVRNTTSGPLFHNKRASCVSTSVKDNCSCTGSSAVR
jgi:hypothetical protein